MSIICGHCNRKFPTRYSPLLIWCKVDEMYVCRCCWEEYCDEGHGAGYKNTSRHPISELFIIIIVIGFFVSFGVLGLSDLYRCWLYNSQEISNISEAPKGELVKLEGTIVGNSSQVIITGYEEKNRYSYEWIFEDHISFQFTDSVSSIKASTERYYRIENGLHPAPNRKNTNGEVYNGGDNVTIVGRIEKIDGEDVLIIIWMGPQGSSAQPSFWSYLGVIFAFVPTVVLLSLILIRGIIKSSRHKKKVEYRNPRVIDSTGNLKDLKLNWQKNNILSRKYRLILIFIIISLGILLLITPYTIFSNFFHTQADFLRSSIIGMVIIPLMFGFPLLYVYERSEIYPDEVAISNVGLHFYYYNYIMRYLKDDFIGWSEIKEIKKYTGKTTNWFIEKKNKTSMNITGFQFKIRYNIISKFQEWKSRNN